MPKRLTDQEFQEILDAMKQKIPTECYGLLVIVDPKPEINDVDYHVTTNLDIEMLSIVLGEVMRNQLEIYHQTKEKMN
jgi:hypothetical protein